MYITNQEIMKTSLVITTINSPNKNIRKFEDGCKKKKLEACNHRRQENP